MRSLKHNAGAATAIYADKSKVVNEGWSMDEDTPIAYFHVKGKIWGSIECQYIRKEPMTDPDNGPLITRYVGWAGRNPNVERVASSMDWQSLMTDVETTARTLQAEWAELYHSINR